MSVVGCGSSQIEVIVYEEPRREASVGLVALPTAISVGRMFVANTLYRWRFRSVEERLQAITAELVRIAVEATGPVERTSWTGIAELSSIKMRMLGFDDRIVIEVVDRHNQTLFLADDDAAAEDQGGLPLIDALAARWGSHIDPIRGRVMWAAVTVYQLTDKGLPKRKPPTARTRQPSESSATRLSADTRTMQRVRDGLKRL